MKIAIVGSRKFPNLDLVEEYVKSLPFGTIVISGGAKGVDLTAASEAQRHGIEVIERLPDYKSFGSKAPLLRNMQMVKECDSLVAFWDGKSKGTAFTILNAYENDKLYDIFTYLKEPPEKIRGEEAPWLKRFWKYMGD